EEGELEGDEDQHGGHGQGGTAGEPGEGEHERRRPGPGGRAVPRGRRRVVEEGGGGGPLHRAPGGADRREAFHDGKHTGTCRGGKHSGAVAAGRIAWSPRGRCRSRARR